MKIYFEDGAIKPLHEIGVSDIQFVCDARYGYYYTEQFLDDLREVHPNAIVYTNQITAISNRYAWNAELKVPEVYIRNKNGVFTRIDKLTNKELREAHNLMRMYIANEFGNFDWM